MSLVTDPDPQDSLSITVDTKSNSNASSFPSPGSSFLPPPMPQAHEFALPPASKLQKKIKERDSDTSSESKQSIAPDMPDNQPQIDLGQLENLPSSSTDLPITPTPIQYKRVSVTTPTQTTSSQNSSTPSKHLSRASLHSNRPAPQSPATSRPTSTAASITSSKAYKSNRQSVISSSPTPISPKIRDFAYPTTDERHYGRGPDAPNNRKSIFDSDSRRNSGWSGFKWGFGSRFSWSFPLGTGSSPSSSSPGSSSRRASELPGGFRSQIGLNGDDFDDEEDYTPSKQDFDRNFAIGPNSPVDSEMPGNSPTGSDDQPLVPGVYRAVYPFVPEGTAEMALEEDQLVKIIGRGGGVGWAIAIDEGTDAGGREGNHALVPESYLEFVRPFEAGEVNEDEVE